MEETNELEQTVEQVESEIEEHNEETEKDTTDWKARHDELAARLQRAEKKLDKQKIEKQVEKKLEAKTEGLSDAVLDFFELKGYSDDEVEVFENIMKRTGMSHREVVKDEYATSKIDKMRKDKQVADATPSGTRRSSNSSNDEDYWFAKYQQTGELPTDFALRSKVINRFVDSQSTNKPMWHK